MDVQRVHFKDLRFATVAYVILVVTGSECVTTSSSLFGQSSAFINSNINIIKI